MLGVALWKSEHKYHGYFDYTLERIQHITIMISIEICYTECRTRMQIVPPTLPGFQYFKGGIEFLDIYP